MKLTLKKPLQLSEGLPPLRISVNTFKRYERQRKEYEGNHRLPALTEKQLARRIPNCDLGLI